MMLLHVADIHLGYRQYGLAEREDDIYRDAWETVDIAIREHVDAVLISGDLFDQPKPPIRAIKEARRMEEKLAEKGIRIYAVLGDHDTPKQRDYPPHVLLEHTRVLGTLSTPLYDELVLEGGLTYVVAGISYQGRGRRGRRALREMLSKASPLLARGVGVLMMHQGIKEFFPLDAHLSIAEIPGTARYVAMGHLHRRVMHRLEHGLLVYPGSIDIIRRDEIGDWEKQGKGPVLVDLSGDEPQAEMLRLDIRPQIIVEADHRNAKWRVREALARATSTGSRARPIIHLILTIPSMLDRSVVDEVTRLIGDKAILRIKLQRAGVDERENTPPLGGEGEAEILAELIGGNKSLAKLILELKDALVSKDMDRARQLADEISESYSNHWRRLLEGRRVKPRTLTDYVG